MMKQVALSLLILSILGTISLQSLFAIGKWSLLPTDTEIAHVFLRAYMVTTHLHPEFVVLSPKLCK